jgi:Tol biopolymer transport system component
MAGRLVRTAILLLGVVAVPAAHATFPGENGRIAIVSARFDRPAEQEEYALRALAPRSRRARVLRDCGTSDSRRFCPFGDPAWSPGGDRLALAGDSPSRIAVAESDGSGLTELPRGDAQDDQPAWSPDGEELVFRRSGAGGADLWIMDADGTNQHQLTSGPEGDSEPVWSVDGLIAFTRGGSIWVVEPDGTGLRQLVPDRGRQPDWSPDGDRLAFVRGSKIFVADGFGTVLRRVTRRTATRPAWSPDGLRIAFVRGLELFTIGPRGHRQRRLTKLSSGNAAGDALGVTAGPDWQPLP